jgi:hypothetical protein
MDSTFAYVFLCDKYNGYHAAKSTHFALVCKILIQYSSASAFRHEFGVTSETRALGESGRNWEKLVVWKTDTLSWLDKKI